MRSATSCAYPVCEPYRISNGGRGIAAAEADIEEGREESKVHHTQKARHCTAEGNNKRCFSHPRRALTGRSYSEAADLMPTSIHIMEPIRRCHCCCCSCCVSF